MLPIFKYKTKEDVLARLRSGEEFKNPLVLYLFSKNRQFNDFIIDRVPSGAVMVNDTVLHVVRILALSYI